MTIETAEYADGTLLRLLQNKEWKILWIIVKNLLLLKNGKLI